MEHLPRLQCSPTTMFKMHFCLPAGDSWLAVAAAAAGSAGGTFLSVIRDLPLRLAKVRTEERRRLLRSTGGHEPCPTCPQLGCCCCVGVSVSLSLFASLSLSPPEHGIPAVNTPLSPSQHSSPSEAVKPTVPSPQ